MILDFSRADSIAVGSIFEAEKTDIFQVSSEFVSSVPDYFRSDSFLEISAADRTQICLEFSSSVPDSIQVASTVGSGAYYVDDDGVYHVAPIADLYIGGSSVPFESLSLNTTVNTGWSGSVSIPFQYAIDYAQDTEIRIVIDDGLGHVMHSPPLVAHQRTSIDDASIEGGSSTLTLVDKASYLAGRDNESFPTFRNTTSGAIVSTLATAAGIKVNGVKPFFVSDEDAKQTKLNDAIQRFSAVAAQEWHVDQDGVMQLVEWGTVGGGLQFDWSTCERSIDDLQKFTKIKIGKRSTVQSNTDKGEYTFPFDDIGFKVVQLPQPLKNLYVEDRSKAGAGYLDAIALYNGDPLKGGKLIDYRAIPTGPFSNISLFIQGVWPCTHITLYVMPPGGISAFLQAFAPGEIQATLYVKGSPMTSTPPGIDDSFSYPYDAGGVVARAASEWFDSLFPSRQWAVDRAPKYLAMRSKTKDVLKLSGRLAANVWLYQLFDKYSAKWKVDGVSWNCPLGQNSPPETTVTLVRQ